MFRTPESKTGNFYIRGRLHSFTRLLFRFSKYARVWSACSDPLEQSYYGPTYLSILQGTWTFPDGVIIKGHGSLSFSPNESGDSVLDLDNYGADSEEYSIRDQKKDGDYGIIKMLKHDGHYHQDRITEFRKTLPDCIANARKPYYDIWALTNPDNYFEGDIRYNDGGRFKGVFSATIEEGYAAIGSDPRIRTLGSKIESSIDNILEIKEIEGRKYNADGKLVAAFEKGKQVSDFRLAQIIAADKAKIEKEKEEVRERQRREKLYEETCKKYGKKYVDAWIFEETFIVGTPEEFLLEEVDVKPYYESNYTRSYRLVNIIGETLVNIDVDKSTGRIKYVRDYRRR